MKSLVNTVCRIGRSCLRVSPLDFLSKAPSNLTVDDLEDFCSLANHYASNTPQSFRKEFYSCLFSETDRSFSQKAYSIYQALCLPVSVQELLQANQLGGVRTISSHPHPYSIDTLRRPASDTSWWTVDPLSNTIPNISTPHSISMLISYAREFYSRTDQGISSVLLAPRRSQRVRRYGRCSLCDTEARDRSRYEINHVDDRASMPVSM